ncbi:cytochrome-c oxidase, cbb3-type subunit III [Luteithermobacter gelatinilyticus]|uniref:cytochrome-c oxidase, cbb3-type subunit III n=1 Tax=Luteithermobacter gelatinilyticus TaxID=2582913 RepID=UPI001105EB92|nr:cytochrome-c oxidase, cbb3-type subunit III [Luteithermobacter gelatinilyticus]|tara:strand:- start:1731 stop:2594 length:864 start_codon:yes stop_codon:yes gene_type:complete
MSNTPEIDQFSGVHTTGHEWDGIKELNNPLPRWWLWTFLATIVWSIGYWVVMPAWPLISDYTKGVINYSQRDVVAAQLQAAQNARKQYEEKLLASDLETIKNTEELWSFAMAGGEAAFGDNCAGCHGSGASGAKGYPNLNDDDWLWGGTLEDIHYTLKVGIRAAHEETRFNTMPAFLKDEILSKEEINSLVTYVQSLSDKTIAAPEGAEQLYMDQCASCHGEDGTGIQELGAPNLTDQIWLYGGDRKTLFETIAYSRQGVMPSWEGRLDPATIKSLAVYVHSLGGGQ